MRGGGGGGSKMSKFYPRSCWMTPKMEKMESFSYLNGICHKIINEKKAVNILVQQLLTISNLSLCQRQIARIYTTRKFYNYARWLCAFPCYLAQQSARCSVRKHGEMCAWSDAQMCIRIMDNGPAWGLSCRVKIALTLITKKALDWELSLQKHFRKAIFHCVWDKRRSH